MKAKIIGIFVEAAVGLVGFILVADAVNRGDAGGWVALGVLMIAAAVAR